MVEEMSDIAICAGLVQGSELAFSALYSRYRMRVIRAAWNHVGNPDDAEDVSSIVFLETWRARARVHLINQSLQPWLLTVTRNVAHNFQRGAQRYRYCIDSLTKSAALDSSENRVEDHLEQLEFMGKLKSALHKLTPEDLAVAELCLLGDASMSTAANALNIPVGTVKSRLYRARTQLRSPLLAT